MAVETPPRTVDMKLELVVIPVSDVDRAKRFYQSLGWRLDADFATGKDFRVVQLTPPGSPCSIIFGPPMPAKRTASPVRARNAAIRLPPSTSPDGSPAMR